MGPGERVHVDRLTGMSFNVSCVPWPWVGKGIKEHLDQRLVGSVANGLFCRMGGNLVFHAQLYL